jgi:hypothetical protein
LRPVSDCSVIVVHSRVHASRAGALCGVEESESTYVAVGAAVAVTVAAALTVGGAVRGQVRHIIAVRNSAVDVAVVVQYWKTVRWNTVSVRGSSRQVRHR